MPQKISTYADFDLHALCHRASTLRQGVACACDPDQRPASGSFNWAISLSFSDSVRWVFRSPHRREFLPMEIGLKLLASEAATLKYLKLYSGIPVPEVYDYRDIPDNEIGIPFILMSEAPGTPLSTFWRPSTSPEPGLDIQHKAKILSQLGAITWKLSQLRFDKIGSLFEENGAFQIKECLSRGHLLNGRYQLDIPRGPFPSQERLYKSIVSAFLEHAESLELIAHCFAAPVPRPDAYQSHGDYKQAVNLWNDFMTTKCKPDSSTNRTDYIIAGDALRDIIHRFDFPAINPGSFPLYHPDLSVNNIFVDDEYNITCIIDWAFASTVPESMLLAPPGLPQSRDEIASELCQAFIAGFVTAMGGSIEDGNVCRYRGMLDRGQLSWKLTGLLNLDSIDDYHLFATLWDSTRGLSENLGQYFMQ